MYGRATNMAKKATKEARDPKITELIKDALKNPKKADLNKDGKLSDYEKTRGAAIEKAMDKDKVKEDLDLGHVDNEPHMIKGDLYRIGKASMDLYKMVDQFDGMGEVDFPSWWQSKIFKAKEALVGAKQYLEFELNEPRIDAVVDVATDVVDETVEDYITSVDDMSENTITEDMNYDKWRRAYNGKAFASKVILAEDSMGNKKRYAIFFRYKETPRADIVSLGERHYGGHEGSGMPFAMSNMQNKPEYLFTSDGTPQIYPFETGSLSANTWTKVTKTIPGNSNLQFDNNSNAGLQIQLWAFIGTNNTDSSATLNQWAAFASGTRGPDNTSTWYTTQAATFEITGVQLEVSDHATSFQHRSIAEELLLCQRYYFRFTPSTHGFYGVGNIDGGNQGQILVNFPTEMRVKPTSLETTGTATDYQLRVTTSVNCTGVPTIDSTTTLNGLVIPAASSHGLTDKSAAFLRAANNTSFLGFAGADV